MMIKRLSVCAAFLSFAGGFLSAQAQDPPQHDVFFQAGTVQAGTWEAAVPAPPMAAGNATFAFVSAEAGLPGKVVKGAPYSADAVTESVQTLADGNRIVNKTTASVARDSEGRTRREQSLPMIGPFANEGPSHKMITINDPVAGVTWMLNDEDKTAHKLPQLAMISRDKMPAGMVGVQKEVHVEATAINGVQTEQVMVRHFEPGDMKSLPTPKSESLGSKNIDGIMADGTRTTITIAAGAVGNDKAIEMVDERWVSSELQTLVMSKHSDPRMGETTYHLTNVSRSEPAASLFQVPADYKVAEGGKAVEFRYEKRIEK
jgi:hypothetical protein